ncbi:uncharacterized protein LOC134657308 [Cydia amplana]|uniref:uncharacterized protein LOC134656902 n=1 Tax=Cydia amplana TaxID=1869771 RepID=UPI002FE503A9
MSKRKSCENDSIKRKIALLELQLLRNSKRKRIVYSDHENEDTDTDMSSEQLDRDDSCTLASPSRVAQAPEPAPVPKQAPAPAIVTNAPSTSDPTIASLITQDTISTELDDEILEVLGDAPKSEIKMGKPTHKDLASRWQEILDKGLVKETKDKLTEAYLIPENCDLLVAPLLNPEVKAALADNLVKRDNAIMAKQHQIAIAIAALNQAAELIIAKEQHTKILKPISDACRLLCDSHCSDTKTRRGFVISAINPDMKDVLSETKRNKFLFGDNVSEKLKSAKTIKLSGSDLKQAKTYRSNKFHINNFVKTNRNNGNNRLNWKTMPRKITPKADYYGRSRQSQRSEPRHGSQRRGTAERPAERSTAWRSRRR